jgi:two-component system chemotaxis response regulator CheY
MKVFIVDDASFVRLICRYHLSGAGFQIIGEAFDGLTAESEIQATQPDCVIMDLALPEKNGAEVMRDVQAKFPQIQFVVVSALDEEILKQTAPDVVYAEFVKKPFEAAELVDAVRRAIAKTEQKHHG